MVLKAIGLISETFKTVESSYSAQDGKITVRKDRQKRTFDVLRWQDGKPEVVFTSDNRKVARRSCVRSQGVQGTGQRMNTLQNPSLYRDGNNCCFRYDMDGKRKFATVCPVEGREHSI